MINLLKAEIRARGPVHIGRFMELVLGHPQRGYYNTRDPLGADGDFTTAPEISQMFGEMLGAWAAQIWIELGCPRDLTLLEVGPGRGTLMADALRVTKGVKGFHDVLALALMEISPVLREKQGEVLKGYDPVWVESLALTPLPTSPLKKGEELGNNTPPPSERGEVGRGVNSPIILIGNEFLDALPVRHIVFSAGQWLERAVGLDRDGALCFVEIPAADDLTALIPPGLRAPQDGDILELAPARAAFVEEAVRLLKQRGGAAIFIDYGHAAPAYGETLQALRNHEFCPVLEHVGEADLTAHVDFSAIARAAQAAGVTVHGPAGQGAFFTALGIEARAAMLKKAASPVQAEDIRKALHRLTHSDEMGTLFKVMVLTHGFTSSGAGFGA